MAWINTNVNSQTHLCKCKRAHMQAFVRAQSCVIVRECLCVCEMGNVRNYKENQWKTCPRHHTDNHLDDDNSDGDDVQNHDDEYADTRNAIRDYEKTKDDDDKNNHDHHDDDGHLSAHECNANADRCRLCEYLQKSCFCITICMIPENHASVLKQTCLESDSVLYHFWHSEEKNTKKNEKADTAKACFCLCFCMKMHRCSS